MPSGNKKVPPSPSTEPSASIRDVERAIKIGLTKEEILGNLLSAIRAGKITGSDIEAWINEVEGWGKQHVYMYDLTKKLSDSPIWSSPETILTCLKRLHLDKSWQKTEAISFPD